MHLLRALLLLAFTGTSCLGAATLSQQISASEVSLGDTVDITFTLQNGSGAEIQLPRVNGMTIVGTRTAQNITISNGAYSNSTAETFIVAPVITGDYTIPAFDIKLGDGQVLHTQPMKFHASQPGNTPSATSPQIAPSTVPMPTPIANPPFNPNGPVTMPPGGGPQPNPLGNGNSPDTTSSNITVPVDADGAPVKVFTIATPKTTDAYVGETIPMRIECYIRVEVMANQDSLPTIKGSDFLMNNLSTRPGQDEVAIMGIAYHRETWVTAISAPKSGDFPFQIERDTYWQKTSGRNLSDPFGNLFFSRSDNLEHQVVNSNAMTFHVHALPLEGRPDNFTGAIGQLKVTGNAEPTSVTVGQPVTLHFSVSGEGNFDYVKCPSLASDPAWKSYVPSSKTDYLDESRTQGVKNFEQAIIPQKGGVVSPPIFGQTITLLKNGALPLPAASFSYFDPNTKKYVTVPVDLPSITVTGSMPPTVAPPPAEDTTVADAAAAKAADFLPNRLEFGSLHSSLTPVYRHPWFWLVQGGLALLLLIGTLLLFLRSRDASPDTRADEAQRQRSLHQEEDAMSAAVSRNDAVAFFLAARHAVQLQLGAQWRISPESITLAEVRQRDPEQAALLEPLFQQANEVIYSGGASRDLNLAQWELQVRQQLLQLQPAAV
jgi:hypothetical protein